MPRLEYQILQMDPPLNPANEVRCRDVSLLVTRLARLVRLVRISDECMKPKHPVSAVFNFFLCGSSHRDRSRKSALADAVSAA